MLTSKLDTGKHSMLNQPLKPGILDTKSEP